jgi:light-regulated signal transduction histidine kinase (bacteriophytochrome)
VKDFKVDLTNCDKEPIHILGKVQSHGLLVAVNINTRLISYLSENITEYTVKTAKFFLGKTLEALGEELKLDVSGSQFISSRLINAGLNMQSLENANPYYLEIDEKPYNIIISKSGTEILLEFEPSGKVEFDSQKIIGAAISEILSGKSLSVLFDNTAKVIKKIINYDRVMVYRFGEEGHGQVIAEEKNDNLEPFLGLHYPASDIPKQAREMYKLNLTRLISDVNMEPSFILASPYNLMPLDLTHAELRAVSPIHIQYLKNMGVQSSFSISLISKGELWGLIACHSYAPKFINYRARDASKLIAVILSSAMEYRQGEEDAEKFALLNENGEKLIKFIEDQSPVISALVENNITIKDITSATGVAILFDNDITLLGDTPDKTQVKEIAEWLILNLSDPIYYTHKFPDVFKPAAAYSRIASGIIACILSKELKEVIIWFKPEKVQTLNWAGDPDKPVEMDADGAMNLSPRLSFANWEQIVKNTSEKWNRSEVAAVINIREHIIYAIKKKANEIRVLNEKLMLAYEELDAFSFTISHDLRTPLSSIKSYSELLLQNNKNLDDNAKDVLNRIKKCSDKMAFLIKEILNYSRVGRMEITAKDVPMGTLLDEIKTEVLSTAVNKNMEFIIGDTPEIHGDPVMIEQVLNNLISNAVKYSSLKEIPLVSVSGKVIKDETIYTITDNGIGIDINYYNRVFELFKRMDNVSEIEGTGVGLAIVKRIVEKHEGRIWFESVLNVSTSFYVAFKNNL